MKLFIFLLIAAIAAVDFVTVTGGPLKTTGDDAEQIAYIETWNKKHKKIF